MYIPDFKEINAEIKNYINELSVEDDLTNELKPEYYIVISSNILDWIVEEGNVELLPSSIAILERLGVELWIY